MNIDRAGLLHLQSVEGLRLRAYDDKQPNKTITSMSQVRGKLTIGYGHTKTVKVGMTITKERAVELLLADLKYFQAAVSSVVRVDVNQNQFNALVSFCYNVGDTAFKKSTLLKLLNSGNYQAAAQQFFQWRTPASILSRRQAEYDLFMNGFGVLMPINNTPSNIGGDIAALVVGGLILS